MSRSTVHCERRSRAVDAPPAVLWRVVATLGGDHGWPGTSLLWSLRGALDALLGGPGSPRRRRHPEVLRPGDPVDSWQVERVEPGRRLLLRSTMRLPGTARLELCVDPAPDGRSRLVQHVSFAPDGWAGTAYWWAVGPLHRPVFGRLLSGIARAAERRATT